MNTLGMQPPANAVVLFDGTDLSQFRGRDGDAAWAVEDGIVTVVPRTSDIISRETFMDFYLHLEWREPDMPEATGQKKGNSGVYLQGRYEIQVLDSHGWAVPGTGDCGAIYHTYAPLVNACKPALEWQTYDIIFRAARLDDDGAVVERARVTVLQNGIVIQNNAELPGPTGGPMDTNEGTPGPLRLQDHGDLVSYRNIWIVPLPLKGSEEYGPR